MKPWLEAEVEAEMAYRAKLGMKVSKEDVEKMRTSVAELGRPYFQYAKETEDEIQKAIKQDATRKELAPAVRRKASELGVSKGIGGIMMASKMVVSLFEQEKREQAARKLVRETAK